MKLYLAGLYTSNFDIGGRLFNRLTDAEKQCRLGVPDILESYHYIHRDTYVHKIKKDSRKVFLDSGAFSAFTKGIEVDIDAYCHYIKMNDHIIEKVDDIVCASVLDSIGSAQGTYENQVAMEKRGVSPLPCFHYGEDERYLQWYVENYSYITLGGMVPISTPQLKVWLDRIWDKYLTDDAGQAILKVHGFGLTTQTLMNRYPWFSVDSSSWVQIAATGNIIHPQLGVIAVSDTSPSRKQAGRHIDNLPTPQADRIISLVEETGFEMERLRTQYVSRWAYNCWAYGQIGKEHTFSGPFSVRQPELF